ncbi:hypothetical protein C480_20309 [Natrialba aegyptia DSM 13077]|uniref:Uncharacterized protein n=1 Tax=Natrialba aegyptia DSM 13077 TaxID=1227491 RepID=M0AQJ2_9EURY|nr:hypothetical protein C480_20309 [Natrialba aegyptia DSM 13077]
MSITVAFTKQITACEVHNRIRHGANEQYISTSQLKPLKRRTDSNCLVRFDEDIVAERRELDRRAGASNPICTLAVETCECGTVEDVINRLANVSRIMAGVVGYRADYSRSEITGRAAVDAL